MLKKKKKTLSFKTSSNEKRESYVLRFSSQNNMNIKVTLGKKKSNGVYTVSSKCDIIIGSFSLVHHQHLIFSKFWFFLGNKKDMMDIIVSNIVT